MSLGDEEDPFPTRPGTPRPPERGRHNGSDDAEQLGKVMATAARLDKEVPDLWAAIREVNQGVRDTRQDIREMRDELESIGARALKRASNRSAGLMGLLGGLAWLLQELLRGHH